MDNIERSEIADDYIEQLLKENLELIEENKRLKQENDKLKERRKIG